MVRLATLAALALRLREASSVRLSGNSIPGIVWITGSWSEKAKEFMEIEENLNGPAGPRVDNSAFVSARESLGQKRAEAEFRRWVPVGSKIRYLDDEDLKASARNISDMLAEKGVTSDAYRAFANLRPAAYRVDLWRYMVLWAYGGVYLDSDLRITQRLEKWIDFKKDKLVLVNDTAAGECAYWNAMIAATPYDTVLEGVISVIVDNLMNHYYGENALAITGPIALCRAIKKSGKKRYSEFHRQTRVDLRKVGGGGESWAIGKDGTVMATKDEHLHYFEDPKRHYGPMWRNKQVYCDEPGPEEDLGMCGKRPEPAGQNETSAAFDPSAEANLTTA